MYYILLPESLYYNGVQYSVGLNVSKHELTTPKDGFFLCKKRNLGYWLRLVHNPLVCEATLCKESVVLRRGRKIQTDRFVLQNPCPIRTFLLSQNEDTLFDLVYDDGLALEYIAHPSEELCLCAIRQNGRAIRYVANPTSAMLMEAVKQNGRALQYIRNPSHTLCMMAVKQTPHAIRYVQHMENSLAIMAVHANGMMLRHIRNPSPYVVKVALEQNGFALQFVKDPSSEMRAIAETQNPLAKLYKTGHRDP